MNLNGMAYQESFTKKLIHYTCLNAEYTCNINKINQLYTMYDIYVCGTKFACMVQ